MMLPDASTPQYQQHQPMTGGPRGSGGFGGSGGSGPGDAKRRKTLLISSLAVLAVVVVAAAVIALSGGWSQKSALAGANTSGKGNVAASGKPDGDMLGGSAITGAPDLPTGADSTTNSAAPSGGVGRPSASGSAPQNPGASSPGSQPSPGGSSSAGGGPATSAPVVGPTSAPHSSVPASPPAATTTKPAPPAAPSSDCTYLDLPASQMPVIQSGSGNTAAVEELQCLLKKSMLGIKTLATDGQFGSGTQTATVNFQQCNNSPSPIPPGGHPPYPSLATDGVVGQQTWSDLYFWDGQYYNGVSYYCNGTR
jgi:hypothetical protein